MDELTELGIQLSNGPNKCDHAAPISVLIGSDIARKLMTGRTEQLKCGLTAIETHLGWTSGQVPKYVADDLAVQTVSMFQREACVSDLWKLNVIALTTLLKISLAGLTTTRYYNVSRKQSLSIKKIDMKCVFPGSRPHPILPDSKELAEKRLTTTRKLKLFLMYDEYDRVFQDWLAKGIIEVVPDHEARKHTIYQIRASSNRVTTPLRPVLDTSAKSKGSPSLNECLKKGPNLIELISTILLRFRAKRIEVVSDIKKAFLQICLAEKDRDALRFLWYNKLGNIVTYQHVRVVFGVSCSPFLLSAVINHHFETITLGRRNEIYV